MYNVNEFDRQAQLVLVLSNPVSAGFTVRVETTDDETTATGDLVLH